MSNENLSSLAQLSLTAGKDEISRRKEHGELDSSVEKELERLQGVFVGGDCSAVNATEESIPLPLDAHATLPEEHEASGEDSEYEADVESEAVQKIHSFVTPGANTRSRGCTHILYGLSLLAGAIGTGLTINLGANGNDDNDARLSHRALYSFILFVAGLFFEAARRSVAPKTARSRSLYTISEFRQFTRVFTRGQSAAEPAIEMGTGSSLHENPGGVLPSADNTRATVVSPNDPLAPERFALPPHWQSRLVFAWNLLPVVWLVQSLALFIQNAREESVGIIDLLPYTTVTGLATGYLSSVSIKPWKLVGLSRFVESHRNELTIPEYAVYSQMIGILPLKVPLLFAVITGSFWFGYNLEQLTGKFLKRSASVSHYAVGELPATAEAFKVHLPTSLLISLSGITLVGLSLLILQQSASTADQAAVRDYSALWFTSFGNYAATYPLGIYLGRCLPRHHHRRALTVATYLLVPFASPNLTIPHYILLAGGGLCGGVAHVIARDQYQLQLAQIQQQKQRTDALQQEAKFFFDLLPQLHLPNDLLLQQRQRKKRKMTIVLKGFLLLIMLAMIISFFMLVAEVSDQQSGALQIITSPYIVNILCVLTIFIGGFHLLLRWAPSVYTGTRLPFVMRFFYRDSFTLAFLFKVCITLTIRRKLTQLGDYSLYPYSSLMGVILFFFMTIPVLTKVAFRREHGYLPYVPSSKDIEELAAELKPEALRRRIASGNSHLSCSYHLLKFMQENRPELSQVVSTFSIAQVSDPESKSSQEEVVKSQERRDPIVADAGSNSSSKDHDLLANWRPLNPAVTQRAESETIPHVPVAALYSGNGELQLTLEVEFERPYDRAYTLERLDNTLFLQAADAAVRGATVGRQFTWGLLPQSLNLGEGTASISL